MKFLKLFNSVQSFTIGGDGYIIIKTIDPEIVHVIDSGLNNMQTFNINNLSGDDIYINNGNLYYTCMLGEKHPFQFNTYISKISDNKLSEKLYLPDSSILKVNESGNLLVIDTTSEELRIQYRDGNTGEVKWQRNEELYKYKFIDDQYFISTGQQSFPNINLVSNVSGNDLWEFNTEEIKANVSDGELSFFNWNYVDNRVVGYFKSGEVIILSLDQGICEAVVKSEFKYGLFGYFILDERRNKLLKIFRDTYHEIDLLTKAIVYNELPWIQEKDALNLGLCIQDENCLFYINDRRTKVCAFNKDEREIIWQISMDNIPVGVDNKNRLFNRIANHGDNLYILDNKNVLYVFSK